MSNVAATDFLVAGGDHSEQRVRQVTGRFAPENYFSPDVYSKFTTVELDCP